MFYKEQIINKTNIAAKSVLKSCIVFSYLQKRKLPAAFFRFYSWNERRFYDTFYMLHFFILLGAVN